MKKIFVINVLVISSLSISAQNLVNVNTNPSTFNNTQQTIYYSNNVQDNNRGNGSALSNLGGNQINNNYVQTASLPKQQKKQHSVSSVQENVTIVNNGNLLENNEEVLLNNQIKSNIAIQTNVQVNNQVNKVVTTKPVVVDDTHGVDFKPISLSGRDYSNGGKLKKGQKNFYRPQTTKAKHKKRPGYKKVKYHTSNCASW